MGNDIYVKILILDLKIQSNIFCKKFCIRYEMLFLKMKLIEEFLFGLIKTEFYFRINFGDYT